jgi:alanyl-tRNA synthetase
MSRTERLYYNHPGIRTFDATVVRAEPRGDQAMIWLDRTAFYPTSGGQPFDIGTLGGLRVVDVQDDEAGDVVHVVSGGGLTPGAGVQGSIDWERRFDHMQQHTGQHVLSAVLERAFQARTVSFHLGTDSSTIDIDRELAAPQLASAERDANRVVWDDLPVTIRYATDEEARTLPLRKEPARTGTLRLIEIGRVDLSACGGTHVDRTGAIGQIAIASWERFKGGQRIEFLCGARALGRFQQMRDISAASIRLLSVLPTELPAAIERLQGEAREQKRALLTLQTSLADYEAAAFAQTAEDFPGGHVVLQAVDGDAVRLKALAAAVVTRPGLLAVLVSRSTPVLAVAARSADLTISSHELISTVAKEFGGRGGGKPDLAQCGALQASPAAVLSFVRHRLQTSG